MSLRRIRFADEPKVVLERDRVGDAQHRPHLRFAIWKSEKANFVVALPDPSPLATLAVTRTSSAW